MSRFDTQDLLHELTAIESIDSAPPYEQAAGRQPCHHIYRQTFSKTSTVTLELLSSANVPEQHPIYFDGATIAGSITIDLNGKGAIKEVVVKLRGRASTMYQAPGPFIDDLTFLRQDISVWSAINDGASSSSKISLSRGMHSWNFSIALPATFVHEGVAYPLPPSYGEKAYLSYTLAVIIKRDLLHKDVTLPQSIRYVPRSRPGSPSQLRQLSDIEGTPILGPRLDPAGWDISEFTVEGKLFSERNVSVLCHIALGKPRQYTRGTSIPFYLAVLSGDQQAVDLLSNPSSWSFTLSRCTRITNSATPLTPAFAFDPGNTFVDVVSKGRAWSNTGEVDSGEWSIQGEVGIPQAAWPTFLFPSVSVYYAIRAIPATAGFKPRRQAHHIDVRVVTSHSRSAAAGILAGSVPSANSPAPTYQDNFRVPSMNRFLIPK